VMRIPPLSKTILNRFLGRVPHRHKHIQLSLRDAYTSPLTKPDI